MTKVDKYDWARKLQDVREEIDCLLQAVGSMDDEQFIQEVKFQGKRLIEEPEGFVWL
ncbi:hypothetical protein J5TS2_40900 [Brevibacillus halotolerans]|uniref:hypothetical protein n=1 Tax=Brevibacillus halotolerans TaxID=1507437 RepID=UPI001B150BE2|nr:hypothetical protein [Brevibacillus halotolerans]GIO03422.1 hypothetical protein J5TS2_40900 [Brevibacillus halotolerans]